MNTSLAHRKQSRLILQMLMRFTRIFENFDERIQQRPMDNIFKWVENSMYQISPYKQISPCTQYSFENFEACSTNKFSWLKHNKLSLLSRTLQTRFSPWSIKGFMTCYLDFRIKTFCLHRSFKLEVRKYWRKIEKITWPFGMSTGYEMEGFKLNEL